MSLVTRETCGRCGAYSHIHPTKWCEKARLSWWHQRHYLTRHIAAWLWLRAGSRYRWWYCDLLQKRGREWCHLYDTIHPADNWTDYARDFDCGCDYPLPRDVGRQTEDCYYCGPLAGQTEQTTGDNDPEASRG